MGGRLSVDGPARGEWRGCPHTGWVQALGPAIGAFTLGTLSRSLEAISGLEGSGRIFTVLVQGLLQLQVRSPSGGGGRVGRGTCLWASARGGTWAVWPLTSLGWELPTLLLLLEVGRPWGW